MEPVRVATFDCYGTLIDWEGGAAAFLYEIARRHERAPAAGPRAARALGGTAVRAPPGRLPRLPRGAGRQPCRMGRRARLPLERPRRRGARSLDGELAAVPRHRAGATRREGGGAAPLDHLEHRPGDHRPLAPPPRGRVRRRDRGRGLPRLQAGGRSLRARPARDRRGPGGDPARGVRLQVRPGGRPAARAADGVGEPGWRAGAGAGAAGLRVARPVAAGGGGQRAREQQH